MLLQYHSLLIWALCLFPWGLLFWLQVHYFILIRFQPDDSFTESIGSSFQRSIRSFLWSFHFLLNELAFSLANYFRIRLRSIFIQILVSSWNLLSLQWPYLFGNFWIRSTSIYYSSFYSCGRDSSSQ